MPWLNYGNVRFESSGIMAQLQRYYGMGRVRFIFEEIGYDKILFSSDYPTAELDGEIAAMQEIVPAEHHDRVFRENALHLGARFRWWT